MEVCSCSTYSKDNNDPSSISNYRPVSLLPILSKLMEHHIKELVLDQVGAYIYSNQFGFLTKKSTVAALLSAISSISSHVDRNHTVASVFFDLKKAFDSVPHRNS